MKINLTKKQYEDLLKLVYLGNWVVNANRIDDKLESFDALEGYIFSFAKEFGMERWADTKDPTMTYPTRDFEVESGVQEFIEEYDEEGFWDELPDRMGSRDFFEKYSKEEIEKMDQEEYFMKMMECVVNWEKEIDIYGLKRLRVIKVSTKHNEDK